MKFLENLINKAVDKRFLELDELKKQIEELQINQLRSKDDLEIGLDGIIKVFEMKLESLGYKKSIVTDLLKKIAKLEGKDVSS